VLPYLICEQPRFRQRNDLNCFFQQTTPTRILTKNLMLAEHEILIFLYFQSASHTVVVLFLFIITLSICVGDVIVPVIVEQATAGMTLTNQNQGSLTLYPYFFAPICLLCWYCHLRVSSAGFAPSRPCLDLDRLICP
jgi:hypothetical protein